MKYAIRALPVLLILSVGFYWFQFETVGLTLVNSDPYEKKVAVRYERSSGKWETQAWITLKPGETKIIEVSFYRVRPNFFVFAESNAPGLIRWLPNNLPADAPAKVFFDDGEGIASDVPVDRTAALDSSNESPEVEQVNFPRVAIENEDPLYILSDPLFRDVMLNEYAISSANQEEFFNKIKRNAESLATSLSRQQEFDRLFKNPQNEMPYMFEFSMSDDEDNGFMRAGVKIVAVDSKTIFGDDIGLQVNDILIGVNDTEIYSYGDAMLELYRHATDQKAGIAVPVKFTLIRGEEVFEISSHYWFNNDYPWDDTKASAFFNHLGNGLALGILPQIKGAISGNYDKTRWDTVQTLSRTRQLFPNQAVLGELVAFCMPSPLTILKIAKVARGARAFSAVKTAVLVSSIELAEMAVYNYNTSSPTKHTSEVLAETLRMALPVATIGLASGLFKGGFRPAMARRTPKPIKRCR